MAISEKHSSKSGDFGAYFIKRLVWMNHTR
jgi:hypothetical protein